MVDEKGKAMIWWVGVDGQANSYWDASHAPSEHVCACTKDLSCTRDLHPCNCDAGREEWMSDVGILSNKTALPVTEINIGGVANPGQSVIFELGPLVCSGQEVSTHFFYTLLIQLSVVPNQK
jgi:hypothetical protein